MDEKGSNIYAKSVGNGIIILVIYVDDTIILDSELSAIEQTKSNMSTSLDITGLGLLHYCPGVEVWKTGSDMFVS